MLDATIALENFIKFHLPTDGDGDCKVVRRIECAIRGEELYRTFSSAPTSVQKLLFAVFDYLAWSLLNLRTGDPIPEDVTTKYELANSAIYQTKSDVAINGIVAFSDFARKYIFSLAIQNSDYFKTLPEESSHAHMRAVCEYFRACQTDVFPTFVQRPKEAITHLPSKHVRFPCEIPFFLRVPNDPLLILCDTASVLLSV